MIAFIATANSTVQLHSDPALRGRVMALFVLVFLGSTPVGGPVVGWLSDPHQFGPRAGLVVAGASTLAAALTAIAISRPWSRARIAARPRPELQVQTGRVAS
jgi:MFS family permease